MLQWLSASPRVEMGSQSRVGAPPRRSGRSLSVESVLVAALLVGGAAGLGAQTRGTLQVTAQVLPAQPSQLALAQGLSLLRSVVAPAPASLAAIEVSRTDRAAGDLRLADRRRTVLTISFLRN